MYDYIQVKCSHIYWGRTGSQWNVSIPMGLHYPFVGTVSKAKTNAVSIGVILIWKRDATEI